MLSALKKKPTFTVGFVKVPRGDIVGNLGLRNKRRSDVACLSKTVLTVTAVV